MLADFSVSAVQGRGLSNPRVLPAAVALFSRYLTFELSKSIRVQP